MSQPPRDSHSLTDTDAPTRLERLGVASMAVLGWLPIAAFWLYSKHIRVHDKYFPLIRSYSGIDGQGTWLDRLALLRPDLLWSLVLLPIAIFVSHYGAPRSRANRWFWILLSVAMALLLFANLHSWGTIGRFLTGTAAVSAFSFAIEQPQMIPAYIGLRGLSKLIAILVLSLTCYAGLSRAWRCRRCVALSTSGVLAVSVAALGLWGATSLSAMRVLPVSRDFVWQSIEALFDLQQHTPDEPAGGGDLHARFATLTRTPQPVPSAYHGTSRGNDLLVFVLETGSKRFLDGEADLDGFPTLKQLAANSAIASAHHSVFPATAEALFSLYTSTFPARTLYSTCVVDPKAGISRPWDGFMSSLKGRGYFTGAYLPFTSVVPLDKALLGNLGLEKLYYAQEHTTRQVGRDLMALDEVKADIERLISQDRRYAMVFLPQLGHGPWPDRPTTGRNLPTFGKRVLADASVRAYGRMLAQVQDEWLGQIVKILSEKGRLDKTTIVVTGDHGIRTTNEDPDFKSGLIDRYSFEVPLLIHSPSSFKGTTFVRTRTSHIDVSPTLLDLYGFDPIESQQGISIFQSDTGARRLFFDANWYFGADGFVDADNYFMYSEVLGLAFRSKQLEFSPSQVLHSSQDTAEVKRVTTGLYDLQERWIRKYLCR